MYKDKDKQREADKERQRRYRTKRDKHGVTKGVTGRNRNRKGVTNQGVTEQGSTDEESDAVLRMVLGVQKDNHTKPKRGKDIKTFKNLPLDVQETIDRISMDEAEHKRRTVIAIRYQQSLARLEGLVIDKEPYFAPSADTLAKVKALTLREEAKLMAQADPDEVYQAENKGREACYEV